MVEFLAVMCVVGLAHECWCFWCVSSFLAWMTEKLVYTHSTITLWCRDCVAWFSTVLFFANGEQLFVKETDTHLLDKVIFGFLLLQYSNEK